MINTGLKSQELKQIKEVLNSFENIEKTILFGSRAKGNYSKGSDLDLAIYFNNNNIEDITWKISDKLNNETILPYKFDIKNYNDIKNKKLIEHIDRVGIEL